MFLGKIRIFFDCKYKSYSHFFSKNISIYAIFNDQTFNDMLTNDIVSFKQVGPDWSLCCPFTDTLDTLEDIKTGKAQVSRL